MTNEQKIKRYHSEEVMLILFICSIDLSDYTEEDLELFAEDIEGRIEELFESKFLLSLKDHFHITTDILDDFKTLQEYLISLYASRWRKKMMDKVIWGKSNILGQNLLKKLGIDLVEPNEFKQNHLNVDWT